ncbi:hypothetical protein ACFL3K_00135 [Pseudomonadota bacterium]
MSETVTFVMSWFILVLGLSYILQKDAWKRVVEEFLSKEDIHTIIPMTMFMLVFGLAVVANHNIWEMSMRVVITIFGWSLAIKGALYMICPDIGAKIARPFLPIMETWIRVAGVLITLLGALLVYQFGLTL